MKTNVFLMVPPAQSVASVAVFTLLLVLAGSARAQDCYESSIVSPSPFMGNNAEIFKLADGSRWEVKYEYEYLYDYNPSVIICPGRGKLIVGNKSLNVQAVSGVKKATTSSTPKLSPQSEEWLLFEETQLKGHISGTVRKGRVFITTSGNVYEVTGLTLQLVLELQPDVTILKSGSEYKLIVQGFDEPLICKMLSSAISSTEKSTKGALTSTVIETQIDGTFEGWDGETIFRLSNGQVWQQASYAYTYHYAYRPKALIFADGSTYRLKVDGVDSTILVKRLK